jgi:putative spermidine/putrescine transport system substrate-binding protein
MKGRLTRPRSVLLAWVLIGALAATLVAAFRADAQGTTLVVTGYGGRWSDVMKKALVEPFEKKHGVKVEIVTGITTEWVAKLLAAGPDNPPYDVVFGNEPAFPIPRERGFFEKRNETLAPNIKNLYPKALIGDTSLAMFWGRIGLAYRTDTGIKKPVSWKDFWDEAYVGKRATYIIGNTLGINFLFLTSKLYGKDYFDIDAGVAAIKRAQPKLVDFTGTVEKQLEQKEVVIAVLHDASAYDLQKRGIPVDWVAPTEGLPILDQIVQVTRGSKNKELAWKLIDAYLSPEVQLAFATELFWSPTNKTVKVPADVAKKIISGPADVDKLVLFDWAQVAKQRPQWTEKWNKEMR